MKYAIAENFEVCDKTGTEHLVDIVYLRSTNDNVLVLMFKPGTLEAVDFDVYDNEIDGILDYLEDKIVDTEDECCGG